jgi:hypothetical protein
MKAFTIEEMENVFEIGRVMQAMFSNDKIEIEDSKDAFIFALQLAQDFEKEYPDTECYYLDLDEFVEEKIMKEFGVDN